MNDTLNAPAPTKREKILVYFLAANEDQQECVAIKKYLSPVLRNSKIPIQINSDFDIPAGEDVTNYKLRLYSADIVIAFISADFIDDEETYQRTKKVIARYNNNETVMLPILVRNCLWRSTPFVNLPLLPKNFQPLNNKQFWNSEDDALTSVVTDITDSINAFSDYAAQAPPPPVEEKHATAPSVEKKPTAPPISNFNENIKPPTEPGVKQAAPPPRQFAQQKNFVALDENWRGQYYKDVLWKRAVAFFLDNLLTMFPVMFVAFAIASVALVGPEEKVSDEKVSFILLFTLGVYFIVCAKMEASKQRGTFGKRIMKLQITDNDGHAVTFGRAFWRNVARFVVGYSYLLIFPLIIQYFTFKKSKQLFHDQLSKTVIGERLKK